ncbi:Histidinol-phosphatase [Aquisphaera giovannonii]|uniref:3'(2'),5'-bisphosphate nucleotidase n=1 Tax=Aquisphaera giovannonii TaxID=406548 RepID=A0A5B9W5W3_9BACT|nr:3'(2'),5'-bisphosphate nucleotidase [Aquisphaera giovannonii]QEH35717.1 Histidinol-phosphatase [Aquisphaera giovannonii]
MTTEAQILANRRNASLSTGPKTRRGKARSRREGYGPGARSQGAAITEAGRADPRWIEERAAGFLRAAYSGASEEEKAMRKRAAELARKIGEAERAVAAYLERAGRIVEDRRRAAEAGGPGRVLELSRRLMAWEQSAAADSSDGAGRILGELEGSRAGRAWLIRTWRWIREWLGRKGRFGVMDRYRLVRALGHDPIHVARLPRVREVFAALNALDPRGGLDGEAFFARARELAAGCDPMARDSLAWREAAGTFASAEEARAFLLNLVDERVRRLEALQAASDAEPAGREALAVMAAVEGLRREVEAMGRELLRVVEDLQRMRKGGPRAVEGDAIRPAAASGPEVRSRQGEGGTAKRLRPAWRGRGRTPCRGHGGRGGGAATPRSSGASPPAAVPEPWRSRGVAAIPPRPPGGARIGAGFVPSLECRVTAPRTGAAPVWPVEKGSKAFRGGDLGVGIRSGSRDERTQARAATGGRIDGPGEGPRVHPAGPTRRGRRGRLRLRLTGAAIPTRLVNASGGGKGRGPSLPRWRLATRRAGPVESRRAMSQPFELEQAAAVAAVRRAARLCQAVRRGIRPEVLDKKDKSPVTVADFGSQALVCRALLESFPEDPVIAEEDSAELRQASNAAVLGQVVAHVRGVGGGESLVDATAEDVCGWIDRGGTAEYRDRFWTIDPIDGTKGFLRNEQYAVALALVVGGRVVVGALACPNLAVRGEGGPTGGVGVVFTAVRGGGAFAFPLDEAIAMEPVPIRVNAADDPAAMRFCESVESGHSAHGDAAAIAAKLGIAAPPIRMDSQAKYGVVARGEADVYLRMPTRADYREKIWDHAAGALVIEEAGGVVTDVAGRPLEFRHGRELSANRGVVATNGRIHDRVIRAIADLGLAPGA